MAAALFSALSSFTRQHQIATVAAVGGQCLGVMSLLEVIWYFNLKIFSQSGTCLTAEGSSLAGFLIPQRNCGSNMSAQQVYANKRFSGVHIQKNKQAAVIHMIKF